jgi:uncharacterized protein (DUF1778 family)
MARPPKKPSDVKSVDIRIPLTEEQKQLIVTAAASENADVASWVRPIVIDAAQKLIRVQQKRKPS